MQYILVQKLYSTSRVGRTISPSIKETTVRGISTKWETFLASWAPSPTTTTSSSDESTTTTAASDSHSTTTNNNNNVPIRPDPNAGYAMFIDAQNVSAESLSLAMDHLEGTLLPPEAWPCVKRVYGDSQLLQSKTWADATTKYALRSPYHFPARNADTLLVMDAMDILHTYPHIQSFVLLSSDGDFVPLVLRLQEAGKLVHGYGARKSTSPALEAACHSYTYTNQLLIAAKREQRRQRKEMQQQEQELLQQQQQLAEMEELSSNSTSWWDRAVSFFGGPLPLENNSNKTVLEANKNDRDDESGLLPDKNSNDVPGRQEETTQTAPSEPWWEGLVTNGFSFIFEQQHEHKTPSTAVIPEHQIQKLHQAILEQRKGKKPLNGDSTASWANISQLSRVVDYKAYGYDKFSDMLRDLPNDFELRLEPRKNSRCVRSIKSY